MSMVATTLLRHARLLSPLQQPSVLRCQLGIHACAFHTTPPRKDVLFVTVPAFKGVLLNITRVALVVLPFWWRWKLSSRFPTLTRRLWQIPLFAMSLFVAVGLDQSTRTSRWRLLLMSESEELEWSREKLQEVLEEEGRYVLPASDGRVKLIKRVCDRLVGALDDQRTPVSSAYLYNQSRNYTPQLPVEPSAKTNAISLPFKPESANPSKGLDWDDWSLYVIDIPRVNAYVLPTKDIIVYSGITRLLEDDEELLSAVLAHEISHVTERHAVENMGFLALSNVFFDVLRGISWAFFISFPYVSDTVSSVFTFMSSHVTSRAYSRKLELEADSLGLNLMAKAGFDPRAAVDLWGLLNEMSKESREDGRESIRSTESGMLDALPLLRTHPSGEHRLESLESLLPNAMGIFQEYERRNKPPAKRSNTAPGKPLLTP